MIQRRDHGAVKFERQHPWFRNGTVHAATQDFAKDMQVPWRTLAATVRCAAGAYGYARRPYLHMLKLINIENIVFVSV